MSTFSNFADTQTIPRVPPGWHHYSYAILGDGSLGLVRADRDLESLSHVPTHDVWSQARLRLSSWRDGLETTPIITQALRWPKVDCLADGRWVVVAARANPGERGARVLNPDGTPAISFEIGDNVWHLACTSGGAIWVGYGDESAGVAVPPAGSGLASFDAGGHGRWRFDEEDYEIQGCEAMSTTGEQVWACTYDDFPIIRVTDGRVEMFQNDVAGAQAIAGKGDYVVLAGGYAAQTGVACPTDDRVVLLRLEAQCAIPLAEFRVPALVTADAFVCGRDGILNVIADREWHRLSVADWVASLPDPKGRR